MLQRVAALKTSAQPANRERSCSPYLNLTPSTSISNPFVHHFPLFFYRDILFLLVRPLHLFELLKIIPKLFLRLQRQHGVLGMPSVAVNNKKNSFELFWHFTIKWNANGWPLGNSTLFPYRVQMVNKGTMVGAAQQNRILAIKICADNNDPSLEFKMLKRRNTIVSMFTQMYMAGWEFRDILKAEGWQSFQSWLVFQYKCKITFTGRGLLICCSINWLSFMYFNYRQLCTKLQCMTSYFWWVFYHF